MTKTTLDQTLDMTNYNDGEGDSYFAENNTVKFDMQNGKFETIAFARDNHTAIEIASALNLLENEGDKC
jgi:hypothetical protein